MSESLWIAIGKIREITTVEKFSAVLAFAQNQPHFEQIIADYFHANQLQYFPRLKPLPGQIFFQRHGHLELLYHINQMKASEVKIVEITDKNQDQAPTIIDETDYLLRHKIQPVQLLDRQFGRHPKLFAPHEIAKLLWPQRDIPADIATPNWEKWPQPYFESPEFDPVTQAKDIEIWGESLPELKCYMIIDANKHKFLQPEQFHCRSESLFKGKFGEDTKNIAPYLVEIIPYSDDYKDTDLMGIFSEKNALTKLNWYEELGIIIQSRYDFDTLFNHFRRFSMVQDEAGGWLFFRFYDPRVLRQYLEIIARSPAKLNKFFGYDKRLIHAFASGFDDSFYYYQLKALPENITAAPILFTNWERDGFEQHKWLQTREELADYALKHFPQIKNMDSREALLVAINEAKQKGYEIDIAIINYAVAKQSAVHNQKDFAAIEAKLAQQSPNKVECSHHLLVQCVG